MDFPRGGEPILAHHEKKRLFDKASMDIVVKKQQNSSKIKKFRRRQNKNDMYANLEFDADGGLDKIKELEEGNLFITPLTRSKFSSEVKVLGAVKRALPSNSVIISLPNNIQRKCEGTLPLGSILQFQLLKDNKHQVQQLSLSYLNTTFTVGTAHMGKISSIEEDRGYLVSLFTLSSDKMPRAAFFANPGLSLNFKVDDIRLFSIGSSSSRIVQLSLPGAVPCTKSDICWDEITPGTVFINSKMIKFVPGKGLIIYLGETTWKAMAHISHLPPTFSPNVNPLGPCIVIWTDTSNHTVAVSFLPHLFNVSTLSPIILPHLSSFTCKLTSEVFGYGSFFVSPDTNTPDIRFFLPNIASSPKDFLAQPVDYNLIDGTVQIASNSDKSQFFGGPSLGDVVWGLVSRIQDKIMVIELGENIYGICPRFHWFEKNDDIGNLSKMRSSPLSVGDRRKFRIVAFSEKNGQPILTRKPTLLRSTLQPIIIDALGLAPSGTIAHGYVLAIQPGKCVVYGFYGCARGILFVKSEKELMIRVGDVSQLRITGFDANRALYYVESFPSDEDVESECLLEKIENSMATFVLYPSVQKVTLEAIPIPLSVECEALPRIPLSTRVDIVTSFSLTRSFSSFLKGPLDIKKQPTPNVLKPVSMKEISQVIKSDSVLLCAISNSSSNVHPSFHTTTPNLPININDTSILAGKNQNFNYATVVFDCILIDAEGKGYILGIPSNIKPWMAVPSFNESIDSILCPNENIFDFKDRAIEWSIHRLSLRNDPPEGDSRIAIEFPITHKRYDGSLWAQALETQRWLAEMDELEQVEERAKSMANHMVVGWVTGVNQSLGLFIRFSSGFSGRVLPKNATAFFSKTWWEGLPPVGSFCQAWVVPGSTNVAQIELSTKGPITRKRQAIQPTVPMIADTLEISVEGQARRKRALSILSTLRERESSDYTSDITNTEVIENIQDTDICTSRGGDKREKCKEENQNIKIQMKASFMQHEVDKMVADPIVVDAAERLLADPINRPKSTAQFEQEVLSNPGSSLSWISYMAWAAQCELGIGYARRIAQRALDAIPYRLEDDKENIWIAWLRLEWASGCFEEFDRLLADAVARSKSPKHVYLAVWDMLLVSDASPRNEKLARLLSLEQAMLSKPALRTSGKVWLSLIIYHFKSSGQVDTILERAKRSLLPAAFLKLQTKYALYLYQQGECSRAREVLEHLLCQYPKRFDIWILYSQAELQQLHRVNRGLDSTDYLRRLFERMCVLPFSSKRMKTIFKAFLDFERSHGTPQQADAVRALAVAYVDRVTQL